ncbi:MAG: polyhydroxyalkanoate depolymerase [Acetobacteraceae bacterium]|nr:polyhydroxyalkanoate depolymerase [Acetobacteraceae bacterium]MBV8589563.1 polyhydroxyalkanoate depolymerase [Acetobacteraceae bacterium]
MQHQILETRPFGRLLRITEQGSAPKGPPVLVLAPLSGHGLPLLFDMIGGLVLDHDVHVLEWSDARDVPVGAGGFGLEDNISYAAYFLEQLGGGAHLIGLCQSALPALAAAAFLEGEGSLAAPQTLTLIGGKIDTKVNPARVDQLSRSRPLAWYEKNAISKVQAPNQGHGRQVYAAELQRTMLLTYLSRQMMSGGELLTKVLYDDGLDPAGHPFGDAFLDLIDLPAEWYLETMALVFQSSALPEGGLRCRGIKIDPACIRRTALLTIEGERDDIAPPGQTRIAHKFCPHIPEPRRQHYTQRRSGHFSLFHGPIWRNQILPLIRDFIWRAGLP